VVLPWIHRVFALLKRWSLGTYHGLRRKHVDTYLEEFVFRYNRRFYRHVSFEALLGIAALHEPSSYWDIAGHANPRKGEKVVRRAPRRRKTATGMQQDGSSDAPTESQNHAAEIGQPLNMDAPGTTG
jgi:ISXO2-like transposase domain